MRKLPVYCVTTLLLLCAQLSQAEPGRYVAHAGGGIDGFRYCNCLEALNENYQLGHRYFELDFSWTSDDELVIIHGWKGASFKRYYKDYTASVKSYREFMDMKMTGGYTSLTPESLVNWLDTHKDAYIITDIKNDNIDGLLYLERNFDSYIENFIPQIYFIDEYAEVKSLGYNKIILTMYRNSHSAEDVASFVDKNELYALTTNTSKMETPALLELMEERNVFVYLHTYNRKKVVTSLFESSVDGVYTDFLYEH